jgi:gas vesicle protein
MSTNEGGVQKETCSICRESLLSEIDVNRQAITSLENVATKRLNSHSDDIKELTKVSIELAGTSKQLTAIQELLIKNQEAQEKRIKAVEDKLEANPMKKASWYDTEIGKCTIKAAVIIFAIIIFAAIGQDAMQDLKTVLGK